MYSELSRVAILQYRMGLWILHQVYLSDVQDASRCISLINRISLLHRSHYLAKQRRLYILLVSRLKKSEWIHGSKIWLWEVWVVCVCSKMIQQYVVAIRHYYSHLIYEGEMNDNPASNIEIKGIKRRKLHDTLNVEELEQLYKSYPAELEAKKKSPPQQLNQLARKRTKVYLWKKWPSTG